MALSIEQYALVNRDDIVEAFQRSEYKFLKKFIAKKLGKRYEEFEVTPFLNSGNYKRIFKGVKSKRVQRDLGKIISVEINNEEVKFELKEDRSVEILNVKSPNPNLASNISIYHKGFSHNNMTGAGTYAVKEDIVKSLDEEPVVVRKSTTLLLAKLVFQLSIVSVSVAIIVFVLGCISAR